MDILTELKWNHREIRSIIQHVNESQGNRTWERRVQSFAGFLAAHFAFERRTILNRVDGLSINSSHIATETAKQKTLLNELYALLDTASDVNFPDTLASFGVIEQDIEQHLLYLEENLFPLFRITVSFRAPNRTGTRTAIETSGHFNRLN